MKNYFISIIIPVYNAEQYIENCLDTILKNYDSEEKFFEVILVNDGSNDNSLNIMKKYQEKYNNIVIINNENKGVSYTRNCGINVAKGKYVMFVDADDLLTENWKEKTKKYKNINKDIIFISNYFDNISNKISKEEVLSYIMTYNKKNIRISGPYSKLFKLDFLKKNNLFFNINLINGEDLLFNVETLLKSNNYILIKDSIYIVRHNEFSATQYFNQKLVQSEINLNEYVTDVVNNSKIVKFSKVSEIVFYNSIRTLLIRISFLCNYKEAKKVFKYVRKNTFFNNGFKKYKIRMFSKSVILYYLFKYKIFYPIYFCCQLKNKKNKVEYFEYL